MSRRFAYWIWLAAIITGILFFSWLSLNWRWSVDLSSFSRNSLAPQLTAALTTMDAPLSITASVRDDPQLHRKLTRAIDLLKISKADIDLNFTPMVLDDSLQQSYGKLILQYKHASKAIYSLDQETLLRTLLSLQGEQQKWIVFLSGHGEKSPADHSPQGYSALEQQLLALGYRSIILNLAETSEIPANTLVLVIADSRNDMSSGEFDKILEYINTGGNLLWAVEPEPGEQLQQLADALGVSIAPGTVINLNKQRHRLLGIRHPAIIPISRYSNHPATKALIQHSLLAAAAAVFPTNSSNFQGTTLFESIADSWTEFNELSGHVAFNADDGELSGPLPLAVALSRNLENFTQRVCVIGDSDFLTNEYLGYGGNSQLAVALLSWLSNNTTLLNKTSDSPLTTQLDISDTQLFNISAIILFGLPGICFSISLLLWWQFRRG